MTDRSRRAWLRGAWRRDDAAAAPPPRPPWARAPEAAFVDACTRCGACIDACPRGLIARGEGGFPVIGFAAQGCNACGDCARACGDAGHAALGPTTAAPFRWRAQVTDACLLRQRIECRVCGDACDARALRFRPALGGIVMLEVDAERCTGCGECVAPCPVGAIGMA